MAGGRTEAAWAVASSMMAVAANFSGNSKRSMKPDDFNPYAKKNRPVVMSGKDFVKAFSAGVGAKQGG